MPDRPTGMPLIWGFGMSSETVAHALLAVAPPRTRNFGVSDAMFLIAGAALAISSGSKLLMDLVGQCAELYRTIAAYNGAIYVRGSMSWSQDVAMRWSTALWYAFQVIEVLVLSITPAFLLIRLVPPRTSIRTMLRQPSTVAGLAVTFGYFWVFGWLDRLFLGKINYQCGIAVAVGGTVAVAWALLALSGKWKAERSWVDRMGRLIGVAAIADGLLVVTVFGI